MGLIACALFLGSFDVLRVSTHYVGANLAAFWVALGLERFARVRDGQAALAFSLGGFTLLNALLEFRPRRKSRGAWRLDARTLALYESEVRIPLIVKSPYQTRGLRIARPVQAIDIVPTVIELLHIESDTPFDGASLLTDSNEPALILWNKHKVVRTAEWKLYATEDPPQLLRIDRDPGELHNVATKHPEVIKQLRDLRDARLSRIRQSEKNIDKLTTEAVEQMRTLGYIE